MWLMRFLQPLSPYGDDEGFEPRLVEEARLKMACPRHSPWFGKVMDRCSVYAKHVLHADIHDAEVRIRCQRSHEWVS